MTSNLGSDCISALCADGRRPDAQVLQEALHPLLRAHFKPALLARMRVVPYYPIAGQVLHDVARLKLASLGKRLQRRKLAFTYSPELITHMTERCAHGDSGARYIDQWVERYLLPQMVDRLLSAMALGESLSLAHARLDGNGQPMCEFS
jgi:type VI secretion system protein VasG